ncbi:hypothetical protein B0H16DRAFT_1723577 [Mycena metata]|uniref:Uncharacterized protein n=1 Tax=Mycena metata TaxID=1033252 RepID=A0AAD7NAI9_9AGAR|nr:hypothetical protein B0H16DRAFT_1723577 [Mycena metata]
MHFAAKNYLRLILSIVALANAIVVYGTPITNTAPAVEEKRIFGYPDHTVDHPAENEKRIFGYPSQDITG